MFITIAALIVYRSPLALCKVPEIYYYYCKTVWNLPLLLHQLDCNSSLWLLGVLKFTTVTVLCAWNLSLLQHGVLTLITVTAWTAWKFSLTAWTAWNVSLLLHCVPEIFHCYTMKCWHWSLLLHGLPEISHCYCTVCLKTFSYSMECWHWSLLLHGLPDIWSLLLLGMQKFMMSLHGVLKCIIVTAWSAEMYHCYCMDCWKCITVTAWTAGNV